MQRALACENVKRSYVIIAMRLQRASAPRAYVGTHIHRRMVRGEEEEEEERTNRVE